MKGLTTLGASVLLGRMRPGFAQQQQDKALPLATPIRGLIKRNGLLMQPIQIAIQSYRANATAITKVNGTELDRHVLSAGCERFPVLVSPVTAAQQANVSVTIGETTFSSAVTLQPVRKVLVYVLPHSHHDLGYTDIQPKIEEKQMNNILLGIDLARKTADYPEGARFIWNLEVLWGADLFMRRKSQSEKDEFVDAVKKGWISLNGMYANELTGLCRAEELIQLFRYSQELSDRIGTIKLAWHDKPFWHVSPSGKERVLVWMPGHGYSIWPAPNDDVVAGCQEFLDSVDYPYDISYIRWSGHGDNAVPDPQICEFVKSWNQGYEWPKFAISSTSEAFSALEKRYGNELPEFKGDVTPYWEDGAGSSAFETRINRNSADRPVQAAALVAMRSPSEYSAAGFHEAPAVAQHHRLNTRLCAQRRNVDGSGKRVESLQ